MNSKNFDAVRDFLVQRELKFQADEKGKTIRFGMNIPGKVRNVKLLIDFSYDDCYIVICFLPNNAPEQSYPDTLRLINRINYGAKFGNFELDEEDGEIRYRMTVDCEGIAPSCEMIEKSIFIPISMLKNYGEHMIDIIMGYKTYEQIKAFLG